MHSILYGVIDTRNGAPFKVRLSDPLPQDVAFALWDAVTTDHRHPEKRRDAFGRFARKLRPVSYPGWKTNWVKGGNLRPVRFFALRHPDDPDWPRHAPKRILSDDHNIIR